MDDKELSALIAEAESGTSAEAPAPETVVVPELPPYSEVASLTNQFMATSEWCELCETALDCKINTSDVMFLMAVSKAIMDDPVVFQAALVPGTVFMKSSLEVVRGFTRAEKKALRDRLQARNILK